MDLEKIGVESEATNHLDLLHASKPCEPIITFSPDRCRFDLGGSEKSRLSTDLAAEINCVIGEYEESSGQETSLTNLLTSPTTTRTHKTHQFNKNSETEQANSTSSLQQQTNANNSTSGIQLQKRLAKQIAQASQPSTSKGLNNSSSAHTVEGNLLEEETEFGEWKGPKNKDPTGSHSNMENNNGSLVDKRREVEMDNAEVEVITKSTSQRISFEGRKSGGLIPPERLQIPSKPHTNANNSQRKQNAKCAANNSTSGSGASKRTSGTNNGNLKRQEQSGGKVCEEGRVNSTSGPTSEVKPLVQWDSDESEDELSFFPAAKSKGKLTDNLSIDNMSLSGEEDDLHLAPPRPLSRNCPCDPRPWVNSHLAKLPSPSTRATEQCSIT